MNHFGYEYNKWIQRTGIEPSTYPCRGRTPPRDYLGNDLTK